MKNQSLPKDLIELENRLREQTFERPAAHLRERVLRAVTTELSSPALLRSETEAVICDTGFQPVRAMFGFKEAHSSPSQRFTHGPEARATTDVFSGAYWIAIAASILIVLNVSLISASSSEFSPGPSINPDPIGSEQRALRMIEDQQIGNYK